MHRASSHWKFWKVENVKFSFLKMLDDICISYQPSLSEWLSIPCQFCEWVENLIFTVKKLAESLESMSIWIRHKPPFEVNDPNRPHYERNNTTKYDAMKAFYICHHFFPSTFIRRCDQWYNSWLDRPSLMTRVPIKF